MPASDFMFDAERISRLREIMPTGMNTEEMRELGEDVLARSIFTARGSSAVYLATMREEIDALVAGDLSESQVRTALFQKLKELGYDAEKGGFPDAPVAPAVRGSLRDLASQQRIDLIVRTQVDLMQGAGEQWRGHLPEALAAFPAWELIRVRAVHDARDWPARWIVAGGLKPPANGGYRTIGASTGMIALKGDPVWGELGSYDNFADALGVDYPPFAFRSGMGWRPVSAAEVARLGIVGPEGESPEEWFRSRPHVRSGRLPELPSPSLSIKSMPPDLVEKFTAETMAVPSPARAATVDFSERLKRSLAKADAAYRKKHGEEDAP